MNRIARRFLGKPCAFIEMHLLKRLSGGPRRCQQVKASAQERAAGAEKDHVREYRERFAGSRVSVLFEED